MDLLQLEEELKKIGVVVVSGRQDTVVSVQIKGLAGQGLNRALRLADELLHERVKRVLKAHSDPTTKLFTDPTFGPCTNDPAGAAAICKNGSAVPSKGGSQHQAKVLALIKSERIRWERPEYAPDVDNNALNEDESDDTENLAISSSGELVFATEARLFADGVNSGDVIQGNLGDCWFLSALSVVATRSDMLEQTFWRADAFKTRGLFVCKFMKNFVWQYVIIDDRLPVFGFSKSKAGKPYFARCRDPNELWVAMLEKAYAKLHGTYEALIGGFVDVALNDLTGMCSEQVIMKAGFPGFGEDPFAPTRPGQQVGDPFWNKILRYKGSGTLMGCSIQSPPTGDKNVAAESSAGNGLYYKHAYALVDAAEIKTVRNERVKLVKLRNPWGMGEWTGPWSDSSTERTENQDVIEAFFKVLKRFVGGNAQKRVFLRLNGKGEMAVDEISQEEVVEANANDGTFFMAYSTWMQYFTHFFAGIDFPDAWHGRRVEGCWNESTCGGNTTKSTWINNPHFTLTVKERSQLFISLSQEDPRGKENQKIVPIGFHICSLLERSGVAGSDGKQFEMKEPAKKLDAYYRLYRTPKDRSDFQNGVRSEPLPPAIIPGSVIEGVDDDGVPQPSYTFKQAVSTEVAMEPGRYCIVPSMYMRSDKDTGKTNVGSFWLSVYSDKGSFQLEGGERIVEEEEGDDDTNNSGHVDKFGRSATGMTLPAHSPTKSSDAGIVSETMSSMERRKKYEDAKDEILRQAKAKSIGIRELKMEFAKCSKLKRADCRRKLQTLGFKVDDMNDERLNLLLSGLEDSGSINTDKLVEMFEHEISEDQLICEVPELEDDDPVEKLHQEGILQIKIHGANDLIFDQKLRTLETRKVVIPNISFDSSETRLRQQLATKIYDENPTLAWQLRKFAGVSTFTYNRTRSDEQLSYPSKSEIPNPVESFYDLLDGKCIEMNRGGNNSREREPLLSLSPPRQTIGRGSTVSTIIENTNAKSVDHQAEHLHVTTQMQTLEQKRAEKLARLQKMKQQALGDSKQTMALPRLIGGRKSGSSFAKCADCGLRVQITGRTPTLTSGTYMCNGSSCSNVFCNTCFSTLPKNAKLCEDCFVNERVPEEVIGERLRAILIEKIGTSETQRTQLEDLFREFDVDQSGKLSPEEFSRALSRLRIQPPLTDDQTRFLLYQFDTNSDGEVSFTEFKDWIVHDRVWSHDMTSRLDHDELNTVITPVCNDIIERVWGAIELASTTNSWSYTCNSLSKKPLLSTNVPTQEGVLFFQRVIAVQGDEDSSRIIGQLLDRFDSDRTGDIDNMEFADLLSSFGIQAELADVVVMMSRINFHTCGDHDHHRQHSLSLGALTAYVSDLASRAKLLRYPLQIQGETVASILTRISKVVGSNVDVREGVLSAFRQLEWNMGSKQAMQLCHQLRREFMIHIDPAEMLRLAKSLCFEDSFATIPSSTTSDSSKIGTQTNFRRSADVLLGMLLSSTGGLKSLVANFDLQKVTQQLEQTFSAVFAGYTLENTWRKVTEEKGSSSIDQREFIERLVALGMNLSSNDSPQLSEVNDEARLMRRFVTKLMLSLALDALRVELSGGSQNSNDGNVTQSLLAMLLRYSKINEMERQWSQGLLSAVRFSHGDQRFLVGISINQERCLVIRATDPILKSVAEFTLQPYEYSYENIVTHLPQLVPMERVPNSAPQPLVTGTFYPVLNAAILALIGRLRICTIPRSASATGSSALIPFVPFLSLVEGDEITTTLRGLLLEISPPFFFTVTSEFLDFSIDVGCLLSAFPTSDALPSFVHRVADVINSLRATSSAARAFYSLVVNTSSSLSVRFDVIGRKNRVVLEWSDFQGALAGLHDTYAIIQVLPQGDVFSTCVSPAGIVGATAWNFERAIILKEPPRCDLRIDRPVIYTDTVKVATINGPDGVKVALVGSSGRGPAHFVVVTVRKTVVESDTDSAKNGKKARLYCTAYDPWTSCDYAVEGYPGNWSADFFNPTVNPEFELQWREMLRNMYLGISLTPTLSIKVFSKQAKVDQLIGECEVTVASAIARDGYLFEETAALKHPTKTGVTTGRIQLTLSFDATKASDAIAAADPSETTRTRRASRVEAVTAPISLTVSQDNSVQLQQEFDAKLRDLHAQLQTAEQERNDSKEAVKVLKRQLQQAASAANLALDEEAAKWKVELEQALRDQALLQEDKDKRLAVLQEQLKRVTQDLVAREAELSKPSAGPITNLKQAPLGVDASAHDILSAMKEILMARCPERPYNGLKKALAAVAEVPGKVAVPAFEDVLMDFGLAVAGSHRSALHSILDVESRGLIFIEDFFIKLCGDAEAYSTIVQVRQRSSSPPVQDLEEIALPPASIVEPPSPVAPAPTKPRKLNWREMKKLLILNLPDGWETRFTEKGRPYFCNHANRSTQWKHPRPEIEAMYSEWMQDNGASFSRSMSNTSGGKK